MPRAISLNDQAPSTTQITLAHRKGVRQICKTEGLTPEQKLVRVKDYLKNVKRVGAILLQGNEIVIHTSGNLNSTYSFSI